MVCAAPATATEPAGPPALPGLTAPSTAAPGNPLYFIRLSGDHLPVVSFDALRPTTPVGGGIWGGFVDRRIKVIHYAAPLRVAQNEMLLILDAPGAGRAIVSLELEFY